MKSIIKSILFIGILLCNNVLIAQHLHKNPVGYKIKTVNVNTIKVEDLSKKEIDKNTKNKKNPVLSIGKQWL